jgi:hypothetical protein
LLPRLDPERNSNTFDLHARQTNFGAAFTGREVLGLTPGAQFLAYIFNDNLVADNYSSTRRMSKAAARNGTTRVWPQT